MNNGEFFHSFFYCNKTADKHGSQQNKFQTAGHRFSFLSDRFSVYHIRED